MCDAQRFVDRFTEDWQKLNPAEFGKWWHPDGKLTWPGMEKTINGSKQEPQFIANLKAVTPDFRQDVVGWAARETSDETWVFIEWKARGSMMERLIEWSGATRFRLIQDQAIEGVAYWDTQPLWAAIDPSMKRPGLLSVVGVEPK